VQKLQELQGPDWLTTGNSPRGYKSYGTGPEWLSPDLRLIRRTVGTEPTTLNIPRTQRYQRPHVS
jgi:hypothetical protein